MRVVNRIKQYIRDASNVQEVNMVAARYATAWRMLKTSRRDPEKTMAIQIENLADWRRKQLRNTL